MSTQRIPKTMKEMVSQLWYVVIGSNGEGLVSIVKETRNELHDHLKESANVLPTLFTIEQHKEFVKTMLDDEENRRSTIEEERRHKENKKTQVYVAIGTFLLVFWPFIAEAIKSAVFGGNAK